MKNLFLGLLVIANVLIVAQSKKNVAKYVIKWRSVNITSNPKYVRHITCDIMQPEQIYLSSILVYEVDINPGYIVKVRLDVPRPDGRMMNIIDLDVDVCKFFAKEHENNMVKIARQSFDEHGNYTQCPQYKNVALGLFNWTVDVSKIPYAPESDFVVKAIYLLPNNVETLRFELLGSFELRRKRPIRVYN